MNQRVMTCILCPNGCELAVQWEGDPTAQSVSVHDNLCPRGISYALEELTHPTRTLTTSVRVLHGTQCLISVKTVSPIPRDAVMAVRACLRPVVLDAPIAIGEIVVRDVSGTGVDVIATRDVPRRMRLQRGDSGASLKREEST